MVRDRIELSTFRFSGRATAETVVAARSGVGTVEDDGRGDGPVRLALSA